MPPRRCVAPRAPNAARHGASSRCARRAACAALGGCQRAVSRQCASSRCGPQSRPALARSGRAHRADGSSSRTPSRRWPVHSLLRPVGSPHAAHLKRERAVLHWSGIELQSVRAVCSRRRWGSGVRDVMPRCPPAPVLQQPVERLQHRGQLELIPLAQGAKARVQRLDLIRHGGWPGHSHLR
eukprot:972530-Prymnesium_polylepis.1